MRRILFLTGEASGSTLLEALLVGRPGTPNLLARTTFPVRLPMIGESCFYLGGDPSRHTIDSSIRPRPEVESNEAYRWEPPAICGPGFYDSLPGDFRFIYLLRDQRNRIESRVKRVTSGGSVGRADFFPVLCRASADELQSVLGMYQDPRFMILRFEDLVIDPVLMLARAFAFAGLQLDGAALKQVAQRQLKSFTSSAFGDGAAGANERWLSWTPEERRLFDDLCGEAMIRLGYEKDHSWVDRVVAVAPAVPVVVEPPPVREAPTELAILDEASFVEKPVEPAPVVVGGAGGSEEAPIQKKSKRGRKKKNS